MSQSLTPTAMYRQLTRANDQSGNIARRGGCRLVRCSFEFARVWTSGRLGRWRWRWRRERWRGGFEGVSVVLVVLVTARFKRPKPVAAVHQIDTNDVAGVCNPETLSKSAFSKWDSKSALKIRGLRVRCPTFWPKNRKWDSSGTASGTVNFLSAPMA